MASPPLSSTCSSSARAAGLSSASERGDLVLTGPVGGEGPQATEPGALRDAPPELGDAADRTQPTGRLPHQGEVHQALDGGGHGLR